MKKINFIPEAYVRNRARRRLAIDAAAGLAVLALSAGWWLGPARAMERELDDRHATLAREIESVIDRPDDEKTPPAPDGAGDRAALANRLAARVPVTAVIATLAESMPHPMGFSRLSLTVSPMNPASSDGLTLHSMVDDEGTETDAPLEVDIEGIAPDDLSIARFISRLDERPLFANVELSYSRPVESESLRGREFRITVEIPLNRTYVFSDEEAQVRHAD